MTLNLGIAFIGPIGSGKSTMAKKMIQEHGGTKLSFADALREEVADVIAADGMCPLSKYEIIEEMTNPALKQMWRPLLQWWGTEFRREICEMPDYWVKKMERKIVNSNVPVYIDDCRFRNEYEMLCRLGFYFIKLEPNPEWTVVSKAASNHASELEWERFDVNAYLTWRTVDERYDAVMRFLKRAS